MPTIDALPFSSSTEQTDSALRTYLCSQAYLPVDFVSPKNRTSGATLYAPMYVFRASFSANWHASFGFDRQEHYTEYKTELINNVRRTTPVTRTKTVTDWRPANGTARGEAMFAAYAGSNLPAEAIELMEGVHLANVVTIEAAAIRVPVEPFTLSQDHVWSADIKPRLDSVIDQEVKGHRQGNRQNNWSWNATTEYSVSELLFPMEEIQIRFDEKTYNFWIDGSNITRIKHEKLPRDEAKFQAVLIGFSPAVIISVSLLIWWATAGGGWGLATVAFIFVTAAIVGGFVRKNSIETRSRSALISAAGLDAT